MKKKHIFWVSVCLLLIGAPALLNAVSDDGEEEHSNISGTGNRTQVSSMAVIELPPLKLKNPFCALKADDGPCRALMKRFFFNIQTQQCEEFIYGGCEGNQNRFDSLEECEEKCVTDTELPTLKLKNTFCAMKADDGPCRALMKRFFFNIQTQQCEEFIYGGCGGNQNRFVSLEECKEKCLTDYLKTAKMTPHKGRPEFCFLQEDVGLCRGYITRYFYNNESKQCERFKYGGCLGNLNNFESLEECKSTCEDSLTEFQVDDNRTQLVDVNNSSLTPQPTQVSQFWVFSGPSWCLTPADRGMCHANVNRYYYNSVTGKCHPFKYSGCGGNENNFISKTACLKACHKVVGVTQKRISYKGKSIKIRHKKKQQPQPVEIEHEAIFCG